MDDSFTPLERAAWSGFLETYAQMNRLIEAELQAHAQISHVEFEVLLRLSFAEGGRMRLQDLTAQSILSQSGVSRVVDRLERAGLVRRARASEDRRGADAILTEAGAARFRSAAQQHIAFVRATFLRHCSEAELQCMADCWHRIRRGDVS
jgi:DNA-binding MarR family transcriptional regulator